MQHLWATPNIELTNVWRTTQMVARNKVHNFRPSGPTPRLRDSATHAHSLRSEIDIPACCPGNLHAQPLGNHDLQRTHHPQQPTPPRFDREERHACHKQSGPRRVRTPECPVPLSHGTGTRTAAILSEFTRVPLSHGTRTATILSKLARTVIRTVLESPGQ